MELILLGAMICAAGPATAQEEENRQDKTDLTPHIHGTLRGKYEYQTGEGEGRFEVRNARVDVEGDLSGMISYKAEIDLCDEGNIKMLDAYTKLQLTKDFDFTIGQMRVPFTIDAHRSPYSQYFANRSFIAKQVGDVRDVGATLGYTFRPGFPLVLQAGIFNGSGLTGQKDFWTKNVNFSAKIQALLPRGFNLTLSVQKVRPDNADVMMYDMGAFWQGKRWHAEAEYLYKHYAHKVFRDVHAANAFVCYDIFQRKGVLRKISPMVRYDFMTNHSDGCRYLDGEKNEDGVQIVNDYQRSRVTAGVTFSLRTPLLADIRMNYEKYLYRDDAVIKTSEHDKIVLEFVTHF